MKTTTKLSATTTWDGDERGVFNSSSQGLIFQENRSKMYAIKFSRKSENCERKLVKSFKHLPLWLHCRRLRDLWMWWMRILGSFQSLDPSSDASPRSFHTSRRVESVRLRTCLWESFRKILRIHCRAVHAPSLVAVRRTFVDLEERRWWVMK